MPASRANGRLDALVVAGVIALCAVGTGAYAWAQPARIPDRVGYVQKGVLSYSAPASPTSVYGSAGLSTGQPIYTNAVTAVAFHYEYRVSSELPLAVKGTEQLLATISSSNHLTRTISLQDHPSSFHGPDFATTGSLAIATVTSAVAALGQETLGGAVSYTLSIAPSVHLEGSIGSAPLTASFDSPIMFAYSSNGTRGQATLTPAVSSPSGIVGAPATGPLATSSATTGNKGTAVKGVPIARSRGYAIVPAGRPATLLFGLRIAYVRIGALVLLALTLLFAALLGRGVYRDLRSDDEAVKIATRYGGSLVPVTSLPGTSEAAYVEMSTFEALLQVAQKLECPILHLRRENNQYVVVDSGTAYRYSVAGSSRLEAMPVEESANRRGRVARPVAGGDPS